MFKCDHVLFPTSAECSSLRKYWATHIYAWVLYIHTKTCECFPAYIYLYMWVCTLIVCNSLENTKRNLFMWVLSIINMITFNLVFSKKKN